MTAHLVPQTVASPALGDRTVRLLPPVAESSQAGLLVLLDGEFYVDRMPTVDLVQQGQRSGRLARFWTLFVDAGDQPSRWRDCQCSESFAAFVANDLVAWFRAGVADVDTVAVGGLSLSGLQAAFTAVFHHEAIDRVFTQSPSFWWSDGSLGDLVAGSVTSAVESVRLRISCGLDETDDDVNHGPGLHQKMSQLDGCRVVRDAFACHDVPVEYAEIPGGHDFDTWTRDLPDCLDFVLGRRS